MVNGESTCIPLHIPLADSDMLSTVRAPFSGFIFAPDESRRSWTFLSMPVTSSLLSGMTLSRPLTEVGVNDLGP